LKSSSDEEKESEKEKKIRMETKKLKKTIKIPAKLTWEIDGRNVIFMKN